MPVIHIYKLIALLTLMLFCMTQDACSIFFRHIGVKEGLSQTSVMSVYQDELGRMWFGTEEGVSLYDGNELVAIKHSEDSLVSQNVLMGNRSFPIVGDKNGNVYIRSDNRLLHYDIKSERFSCLKDNDVSTVFCKDSLVLVASADTVYTWDRERRTFDVHLSIAPLGYGIQKLFVDSKERLWIGTRQGLLLQSGDGRLEYIVNDDYIYEIIEDSKSNLWIATRSAGMYKYTPDGRLVKFTHNPGDANTIPHNQIRSFAEDNYGNLWIGTFRGLCKYNPATETYTVYSKDYLSGSLNHSSVFSTYKDTQGTIWVGTYYGGVHYFNPETDRFSFYSADVGRDDCLSHFYVGKIVEDAERNLWICTEGGGLNHFDRKTKTFRHFLSGGGRRTIAHNNLKCIVYSQKRDRLYIGTHLGGVSVYDISRDAFINFRDEMPELHSVIGDVIINMRLYKEDTLIIQSRNGFFKLNLTNNTLLPLFDDDAGLWGSIFFVDSEDNLWLANASAIARINMNDRSEVRVFDKKEYGIGLFNVSCIYEDNRGRLFFGTLGSGLYRYDKNADSFISYTAEQGMLQSNYCYDIAQSELNELIVSGDRGLSFLNVDRGTLRGINLSAMLFAGMNYGCGLMMCGNGEVFAGGIGGMMSFFVHEVFGVDKDYGLYFSSLAVNDELISPNDRTGILTQALPYTTDIKLGPEQNNLKISFASNNYVREYAENLYEYKLEGFDSKWTSGNSIVYTNIRPGKYRLRVREKGTEHNVAPKSISLGIIVRHAWYANPVAYVIYILMAYVATVALLRLRRIRVRLRTSLEAERKEKEQIEQLNQAKLQFFANISHEFHTPLTLIVVQIERLLNSNALSPFIHNKLLKVKRQAGHLQGLIGELLDFRRLELGGVRIRARELDLIPFLKEVFLSFCELASEQNMTYTFRAPEGKVILCCFDPKQLQKVFYNLLFNAFKYTKTNGSIEISVDEVGESIVVKVIDSGVGIEKGDVSRIFDCFYQADNSKHGMHGSPSAGIGLSVARSILDLHHATISVESKPSYGSIFIIKLKKGSAHFTADELDTEEQSGVMPSAGLRPSPSGCAVAAASRQPDAPAPAVAAAGLQSSPEIRDIDVAGLRPSPSGCAVAAASRQPEPPASAVAAASRQPEPPAPATAAASSQPEPPAPAVAAAGQQSSPEIRDIDVAGLRPSPSGCAVAAASRQHEPPAPDITVESSQHESRALEDDNGLEQKATVLVVEDNEELLCVLEEILRPLYRVLLARNGREGLGVVRREKPDVVISDVMIPEMSGTQMCAAIKNDFDTCHIPVILLTALTTVENNLFGLQHGADDYICKPFDERILLTRCNNLVRGRLIIKNKFCRNVDFDLQSVSNSPIDQKFLDRINRIIENHLDNPQFSVATLASELNISRSSMYAKFEALTGLSPNDYVLQRRLRRASELLTGASARSVAEVSDALAFGSPRYFSRCFKAQFGVSPADYRRNHSA